MIRAWWYPNDGKEPDEVTLDEVSGKIDAANGLVWIDSDHTDEPALDPLLTQLGVNEFAREDLVKAGQRTKLAHYTDHFHVAVYDCVLRADGVHAREIDIVFGAGWALSIHQAPDNGDPGDFPIDLVRRRFGVQRAQHRASDVGLLLWSLLDVVVDRYFVVTETVDDHLDEIEDAILAGTEATQHEKNKTTMQLFSLGKALVRFRRAAVPLRDVTAEIVRREVPCIDDTAIVHFQDLADHVLRVSDFVESQRDVLTGLRDAELAAASNRLSESQQRIAAWGAILIVATLITGVLGMNFRNAPELDWEIGFLVIAGLMLVLGIPIFFYFKRKDWI
ncbi:MAG: magnesium transporter CorA family protein [Acidimicrobiia bacterium]